MFTIAKYGSDDLEITIAATSIKNYVDTINGWGVEALTQESHAFGDSWVEHLYTGIRRGDDLTFSGFYDDTATTGPDALLNTLGTTVAVVITWGGSKTSSFSAVVAKYTRVPVRGELTRWESVLRPSGAVTEA